MSVAGTPILITAYTHGKRTATQKLRGLSRFHSANQSRSSLNSWSCQSKLIFSETHPMPKDHQLSRFCRFLKSLRTAVPARKASSVGTCVYTVELILA